MLEDIDEVVEDVLHCEVVGAEAFEGYEAWALEENGVAHGVDSEKCVWVEELNQIIGGVGGLKRVVNSP